MGSNNDIDVDLTSFTYEVASLLNRFTPPPPTAVVIACNELEVACRTIQVVNDQSMFLILTMAIEHGAPIYNGGSPMNCTRIYRYAANRLIELIRTNKSTGTHTRFTRGVQEAENLLPAITPAEDAITAENADDLAWKLRKAFDRILDLIDAT